MSGKKKTAKTSSKKEIKFRDAKVRAMTGLTRDGFDNFLSRIGLNNDNSLSESTYTFNMITRNRALLEAAYRGSWVVGAAVDSVANDMTRSGIQITTSEKKTNLEEMKKAESRLQVWSSFNTGIKWGRLYGGALGIIMIKGQDLATPLDIDTVAKDQFQGIGIYDRWMLNPIMTPVITEGPEMGLPVMYQIVSSAVQSLGGPDSGREQPGKQWNYTGILNVHHTRVIRFIGIQLPFFQAITEMFWGESILERLWDRLISFDNASMSSAQLIDRANLRTVGISGLREIIAAGGEAQAGLEAMFGMMRLVQVNEGLTLIDKEDEFSSTSYTFAGLSDLLLQFAQQISGATGIPLRRLFSQVPAGLGDSGDADIRLYYDNINAQQEAQLRRAVDVVYKVLWRSVYGKPTPADFDFTFTPLWQMTAQDKAAVGKTQTETVLMAYEAGLVPAHTSLAELREGSGETGIFTNITDKEIAEAESEPPPLPGEMNQEEPGDEEKPKDGEEKKEKAQDSFRTRIGRWLYGVK